MSLRSPTEHENQTYATACSHLRDAVTPIQPSPVGDCVAISRRIEIDMMLSHFGY
jgi:hypothetical protein